jgi:hypothetical protein
VLVIRNGERGGRGLTEGREEKREERGNERKTKRGENDLEMKIYVKNEGKREKHDLESRPVYFPSASRPVWF